MRNRDIPREAAIENEEALCMTCKDLGKDKIKDMAHLLRECKNTKEIREKFI